MMYERYFNNLTTTLSAGVDASSGDLFLADTTATLFLPFGVYAGEFARATLVDPADPDNVEIVYIISTTEGAANQIKVIRGREGTTGKIWEAGAKLECRVTAGMLGKAAADSLYSYGHASIAIAYGDGNGNIKAYSNANGGSTALVGGSWSIGGYPVMAETGFSLASFMASSVEGVGASYSVDLGAPPDFNGATVYGAGAVVKDPNPPYGTYSRTRVFQEGAPTPALTDADCWALMEEDVNGGIFSVRLGSVTHPDTWFYPSEIGFICDSHGATTAPTVSVGEVDGAGALVSLNNLANAVALTAVTGPQQRFVLTNTVTKGVRGMIFSIDTAATGGAFKGRFYWKGLFICSNSPAGWPPTYTAPDGLE